MSYSTVSLSCIATFELIRIESCPGSEQSPLKVSPQEEQVCEGSPSEVATLRMRSAPARIVHDRNTDSEESDGEASARGLVGNDQSAQIIGRCRLNSENRFFFDKGQQVKRVLKENEIKEMANKLYRSQFKSGEFMTCRAQKSF